MNCHQCEAWLQDYSDGLLPQTELLLVAEHLGQCTPCRNKLGQWQALNNRLRNLPKPVPAASLRARILAMRRRRMFRTHAYRSVFAVLAVSVAGVAWLGRPPAVTPDLLQVQTPLNRMQQVSFLVDSQRPLDQVQFSLQIPRHVALQGYGEKRSISWQGKLRKGQNLLKLPVISTTADPAVMVLRIKHGDAMREYKVEIHAQS